MKSGLRYIAFILLLPSVLLICDSTGRKRKKPPRQNPTRRERQALRNFVEPYDYYLTGATWCRISQNKEHCDDEYLSFTNLKKGIEFSQYGLQRNHSMMILSVSCTAEGCNILGKDGSEFSVIFVKPGFIKIQKEWRVKIQDPEIEDPVALPVGEEYKAVLWNH